MPNKIIFENLSDTAFVRVADLLRSAKNPNGPLPISPATFWRKVRAGTFAKPVKLSANVTAWRVGDVRACLPRSGVAA